MRAAGDEADIGAGRDEARAEIAATPPLPTMAIRMGIAIVACGTRPKAVSLLAEDRLHRRCLC